MQVGDGVLPCLTPCHALKRLNLSNTAITAEGLLALPRFPHLAALTVEKCRRVHGSVPGLQALPSLESLSFSRSVEVSATAVLSSLRNCTRLTALDLSWCKGAQQPYHLALEGCRNLRHLQVLGSVHLMLALAHLIPLHTAATGRRYRHAALRLHPTTV